MTTKTKKQKTESKLPKLPSLVTAESDVLRRAEFAVETSTDGGRFSPGDYEAFQVAGWDRKKLLREAARMTTIRTHQRIAGTAAEREAAEFRLAEVQQALETRAPKIETQITTLQKELQELRDGVREAEVAVQPLRHAVKTLRMDGLMPAYFKDALNDGCGKLDVEFGARIRQIRSRTNEIDIVLKSPREGGSVGSRLQVGANAARYSRRAEKRQRDVRRPTVGRLGPVSREAAGAFG